MSRNRGSGSGPFLMEMVIAAGFFMLCTAVCLSAFVWADRFSKNARDVNHAVLAAESLVEEEKGKQIQKDQNQDQSESYQVFWDSDWNRYEDQTDLEKNGKKPAYTGEISVEIQDQMKEISVVILEKEKSGEKGAELYRLLAEQYVKP